MIVIPALWLAWAAQAAALLWKYGPTAYRVVREIMELIDWLRDHSDEGHVVAQNYERACDYELASYRRTKDVQKLYTMRDELRRCRAEREK
jgi:hypothetical protein